MTSDEKSIWISKRPETTKVVDKPDRSDNRKAYSKPELRRLGKLSELTKNARLGSPELGANLPRS